MKYIIVNLCIFLVVKAFIDRLRLFPSLVPVCVVSFQIVNQHNIIRKFMLNSRQGRPFRSDLWGGRGIVAPNTVFRNDVWHGGSRNRCSFTKNYLSQNLNPNGLTSKGSFFLSNKPMFFSLLVNYVRPICAVKNRCDYILGVPKKVYT